MRHLITVLQVHSRSWNWYRPFGYLLLSISDQQ